MPVHTGLVDRPLLLLDVEAVLDPYGDGCRPGFTEHGRFRRRPSPVRADHGARIAGLAGARRIVERALE